MLHKFDHKTHSVITEGLLSIYANFVDFCIHTKVLHSPAKNLDFSEDFEKTQQDGFGMEV